MSVLARLNAFSFLNDCVLVYPFYALMMQDHGLSPLQLSTLFISWSIVAFTAEIPTGVLADVWPRRDVLALGQLLSAAGWACWFLCPSYWGFMAGFVLWGIGGACGSGCFEALVYDELAAQGRQGEITRALGLTRAWAFSGILLAGLLASGLSALDCGYAVLTACSVAAGLASAWGALSLPRVARTEPTATLPLLRAGLNYLRRSPALPGLLLVIALSVALYGSLEEYFQLFGAEKGLPQKALGILMAAIAAMQALGAAQAWRISALPRLAASRVAPVLASTLLLAAAGACLLGSGLWRSLAALPLLLLFCGLYSAAEVQLQGRFQALLPDTQRATLGSVAAFLGEVWAVLVYLGVGAAAERSDYSGAFAAGGMALALTGLLLLLLWRRPLEPAPGSGG